MYVLANPHELKFNYDTHSHNTRNKNNITIDYHRLTKVLNSHVVLSFKVYNKLSSTIDKYPFKQFQNNFYNWLLSNPFYSVEEFFSLKEISF